jgi:hypothetical protein
MIEAELSIGILPAASQAAFATETKKADVEKHFEMFSHVGLLFDKPPGRTGLSFT